MVEEEEINRLRKRVDYLEGSTRWYAFAMDVLTSFIDIHGETTLIRDPNTILRLTHKFIHRIERFKAIAFYTVNEEDSDFNLSDCDPPDQTQAVQRDVDHQIENGTFAWALNQNNCVVVRSDVPGCSLVLHVMSTRTRIRGMFAALVEDEHHNLSSASMNLLSILLNNTAYALESAELYNLIRQHNRDLGGLVAQRTQELAYQAGHDSLTGLTNRLIFNDRLEQGIKQARRTGRDVVVALLDLDQFKRINDTLGHSTGDQLLLEVAERLRDLLHDEGPGSLAAMTRSTTISRLGGDEFGILFPEVSSVRDVVKALQRIIEAIAQPFTISGREIFTTTSVGIASAPGDGEDPEALLKNVETAMYHAKQAGRNNYQFYSGDMNSSAFEHLMLESQLRHALERDELLLYYQPQLDLVSGRIIGSEALIRWQHPEMGMVPPFQFIPLAEETGLIGPIGEWVLYTAAKQTKIWRTQGHTDLSVSVNLSAHQFKQRNLKQTVFNVLHNTGLPPDLLDLELTESALLEDTQHTTQTLQELRDIGVKVSIDDFGTGYSSLNYLKTFPVDTLKVDQSFIRDMFENQQDIAIVNAIIVLAHSLGMRVVAEGVETEQSLEILQERKCDTMQGYYFSRPLPAKEFEELLESGRSLYPL